MLDHEGNLTSGHFATFLLHKSTLQSCAESLINNHQAYKLKVRLRGLTSCLCSTAAPAVCFKGRVASLDATETGNDFTQLEF